MKKIVVLLISFGIAFASYAKNWEHKNISQAVFALDVVKRIPQQIVSEITNDVKKIYFYTNFRNLEGKELKHRWIYNGKTMAEVKFFPKGPRWRVYSSKNLWHAWTGVWTVEVVEIGDNENILLTKSFNYKQK